MNDRLSAQARAVLSVLSSEPCHLTAEEILSRAGGVGTATVYRALDRLVELGLARRLPLSGKSAVYEYARPAHAHFLCARCGRVYDIPADLSGLVREAARACGHSAERSEVTAYGVCKSCLASEAEGFHDTKNIQ